MEVSESVIAKDKCSYSVILSIIFTLLEAPSNPLMQCLASPTTITHIVNVLSRTQEANVQVTFAFDLIVCSLTDI